MHLAPKRYGVQWYVGRRPRWCLSIDLRGGQWHMSGQACALPRLGESRALVRYTSTYDTYRQLLSYHIIITNVSSFESLFPPSKASQMFSYLKCYRQRSGRQDPSHECFVERSVCRPPASRRAGGGGSQKQKCGLETRNVATSRARTRSLSVGSKWRLCVIDTVEFQLKMFDFVMQLVVGRSERYPGTSGRTLRTRRRLPTRSKYVSQTILRRHFVLPTQVAIDMPSIARGRLQSRSSRQLDTYHLHIHTASIGILTSVNARINDIWDAQIRRYLSFRLHNDIKYYNQPNRVGRSVRVQVVEQNRYYEKKKRWIMSSSSASQHLIKGNKMVDRKIKTQQRAQRQRRFAR